MLSQYFQKYLDYIIFLAASKKTTIEVVTGRGDGGFLHQYKLLRKLQQDQSLLEEKKKDLDVVDKVIKEIDIRTKKTSFN